MFSAENLLKDSFLLSLCKYTFLLIILTKTPNLIGAQVVHFCLTTDNPYDVCKRTLAEAKEVYRQMKFKGYRLSCSIHGCTKDDDSVFLTFTPW